MPRVNGATLKTHVGAAVLLLGRVESAGGGGVVVAAADGQRVTVRTERPSSFVEGAFVEVVGTVQEDASVQETEVRPLQGDVGTFCFVPLSLSLSRAPLLTLLQSLPDLGVYNDALQLAHGKFKELFC